MHIYTVYNHIHIYIYNHAMIFSIKKRPCIEQQSKLNLWDMTPLKVE